MGEQPLRHRISGTLVGLAFMSAAACGGGGGAGAAPDPDADGGAPACIEELVAIAQQEDVVAAARAGQPFPDDDAAAFQAAADECESVLATLSQQEIAEFAKDLDPAVLMALSNPQPQPLEQTADSISG